MMIESVFLLWYATVKFFDSTIILGAPVLEATFDYLSMEHIFKNTYSVSMALKTLKLTLNHLTLFIFMLIHFGHRIRINYHFFTLLFPFFCFASFQPLFLVIRLFSHHYFAFFALGSSYSYLIVNPLCNGIIIL